MSDSKPESEILFGIVRERYGDRLNDDELEEVRKGVDALAEAAESLREVKLENGDEPFSVFTPYRGED